MEFQDKQLPNFFSQDDFIQLSKFSKQTKEKDNTEQQQTYDYLKSTYRKVKYWAEQVQQQIFPNGSVHIVQKPTNQANKFESYQWAKIFPDADSAMTGVLAYTVGIAVTNNFEIKIDTVGLPEHDKRRQKYNQRRGDFSNSDIVKLIPYQQVLDKGWKYLIDLTTNIITSLQTTYDDLYNSIAIETEKITQKETVVSNQNSLALNCILYGPPGTGKTYHTIDRAIEIIDKPFYDANRHNRENLKQRFNELIIKDFEKSEGQIAFCTFHQSMSYEDFIEGIKPMKPEAGQPLSYDVEDGIFKAISLKAQSNFENSRKENKQKLSFEDAFEKLKEEWESNKEIQFPLKTPGYEFTITGFSRTSILFRKKSGGTGHTLSINTLREQYYGKEYNFKMGVGIYYPGILQKLHSYEKENRRAVTELNYVLIIDEINRGNVSQIFGELITLIETDKRSGKDEALSILLPYSKEAFSVPSNLYIIGTMNTADRSVEALDTALRRRFIFEEMEPKPELLSPQKTIIRLHEKYPTEEWDDPKYRKAADALYELIGIGKEFEDSIKNESDFSDDRKVLAIDVNRFQGIHLDKLLSTINRRLEVLLSKDNMIGHAWLMDVYSLSDLQKAFKNKILPLLQEYFYNNYEKIGLVLGSSFFEEPKKVDKHLFASFKSSSDLVEDYNDKALYTFKSADKLTIEDFQSIYPKQ